ncbi:hypothetical protein ACP8HZ_04605 [Francisella noatunensis]
MSSIRDLLSKVFTAYMAGLISGLVIEIISILVTTHSLNLNEDLKLELYRMMIWVVYGHYFLFHHFQRIFR